MEPADQVEQELTCGLRERQIATKIQSVLSVNGRARGLVRCAFNLREVNDLSAFAWEDFLSANCDPDLDTLAYFDGVILFGVRPARWRLAKQAFPTISRSIRSRSDGKDGGGLAPSAPATEVARRRRPVGQRLLLHFLLAIFALHRGFGNFSVEMAGKFKNREKIWQRNLCSTL